jgi:hypothetical protein
MHLLTPHEPLSDFIFLGSRFFYVFELKTIR